ncbi:hypothetical protein RJ640_012366 [Escallonia rubra]|uniref:Preprotein translocase SecA family protein n=1 Tax=Escallonia rubra TaxID=112253 RepID=A0AA88QTZ5_9ASTE|nr:hypothetical protein RJ640_012366 [Escallonia rubra]
MDAAELPECPVCLQAYDGGECTPRVLACGHSACEVCLVHLPKPFPHTLRCPACTQLVHYPHPQGPSALPKNIDLLRLSSLLQPKTNPNFNKTTNPATKIPKKTQDFMPNLWSHELYSVWKNWVLPENAVSVELDVKGGDFGCIWGRAVNLDDSLSNSSQLHVRCLIKGNQEVSLVKVGCFDESDCELDYGYLAKVMLTLCGMRDGERDELGLVLRASLRQRRLCKVYGLWYNEGSVYIVCERHDCGLLNMLDDWENGFFLGSKELSGVLMIGMEICEAVMGLHSEGLIAGVLSLPCFEFDDLGRVYISFNEVFVMCGRLCRIMAEAVSVKWKLDGEESKVSFKEYLLKNQTFVSPELLFEVLQKGGIELGPNCVRYAVGYGSDVWQLACVLLSLLVGKAFIEETDKYVFSLILSATCERSTGYMDLYRGWLEKVTNLLESRLGSEFVMIKEHLCNCLDFDPGKRPRVINIWKCIRELIIKPKLYIMDTLEQVVVKENAGHCLVLGELCQLLKETNKATQREMIGSSLEEKDASGRTDSDQPGDLRANRNFVEGLSKGRMKCINLKGHRDCITGLAVGGDYLFGSSFDKAVHVWSLQDFTHVHSYTGHEHRVMAVVFVDEEQPLCISGDSGGGICIWGIGTPFGQEPIKRLYEEKDWRYSGIHALTVSGTGYLYTGSGDKSVKAWSIEDYTLSCTMTGHKSVVSALAVCNGILYSGSWDGTVRLWCLSDHSPLTVLGEDTPGNVTSILSLAADRHALVVAHENGCLEIWGHDVLLTSMPAHQGAIFSVSMEGKWLFTGGWDKTVIVQELSGDDSDIDTTLVGSIACDSVITALLSWQGKLIVGLADRCIKVQYITVGSDDSHTKDVLNSKYGPYGRLL